MSVKKYISKIRMMICNEYIGYQFEVRDTGNIDTIASCDTKAGTVEGSTGGIYPVNKINVIIPIKY